MGLVGGIVGLSMVAGSVYQGEQGRRVQKRALRDQEAAQRQAEINIVRQRQENEMETNRVRQKTPDLSGILASAQRPRDQTTLLTGPLGVDPERLRLGRSTLLGD